MLKRILVLLGETRASIAAREYAFRLAHDKNAELTGLAGVDLSYIEAPMLGGIGTSAYKARLEEQLKKQAEDACARLHNTYEKECKARNVPFEWLCFDGDPISTLYFATENCDLAVTGHDTAFQGNVHEPLAEMLAKLLLMTPRPVIVCGDEVPTGRDVLISYDGSVPAMRAVQIFTLLGLAAGRRVHVTSIDADKETATRRIGGAVSYLSSHGYETEANPIATRVHPAEVVRIEVADRKIGTLVMGAYGHRGFRERLFGSTTTQLVENPPCALFLYH
jgi:nucleotide-binding universal stress UspA family protein